MKVYVAGKWEEAPTIREYANLLRADGHEITEAWFERDAAHENTLAKRAIAARSDYFGVIDARAVIFVFEKNLPYRGSLVELGIALTSTRRPRILVVGNAMTPEQNIFLALPQIERYATFEEARQSLKERMVA